MTNKPAKQVNVENPVVIDETTQIFNGKNITYTKASDIIGERTDKNHRGQSFCIGQFGSFITGKYQKTW